MRSRLTLLSVLAVLSMLCLPAVTEAWCNGPSGGDSYGTHDWILQEADRLAAKAGAGWVRLPVALPHTDDPDTVFHDFYYHVYERWNGKRYGDAPAKVAIYYGKALAARKAGNWTAASRWVGIMSHYFADICQPMHTDQTPAEDAVHAPYERAVQTFTDSPGQHDAWITFAGYKATTNVAAFTQNAAAQSHKSYSTLVRDYAAAGMSPAVMTITTRSLNRAANGIADLIISIKKKVGGGTASSGGGGSGGGGGTAGGSTIVYITATGSCYHRAGCRYLARSCIRITLAKAKAEGYRPCSVCKPPR